MIRINLLPKEERIAAPRLSLPNINSMVPVAVLGGVILVIGITAVLERAKVSSLNRDVVELREEVRSIQPQVDRVRRLTAQREDLERRLDIIRELDQGRFLSVRVLDNNSREVPRYCWLTNVQQMGLGGVTITGITFSNLIVADFMMRLERSEMFANIDLTQTNKGQIENRDVMEFSITAQLTPNEAPTDFSAEAMFEGVIEEAR
jgi:type IV pilus assembly protein PilN